MAYDEEFRQLVEDARDAVRALLDESEHDSWSLLRHGYGQLRDALVRDDRQRETAEATRGEHEREADEYRKRAREKMRDYHERNAAWRDLPQARRDGLVLQALGDERLTIAELTARLNGELNVPPEGFPTVYERTVRSMAARMLHAGQLGRTPEPFQGKVRYRYWVNRTLDGPIAGLERAFQADPPDSALASDQWSD